MTPFWVCDRLHDERNLKVPALQDIGGSLLSKRTTGVVRWFDGSKGYGYIDTEDGEDVFVHYRDILDHEIPFLSEGESVAFFLEQTVRGPQAIDVTRLS